jgi:hypothetical protein
MRSAGKLVVDDAFGQFPEYKHVLTIATTANGFAEHKAECLAAGWMAT